MRSAGMRTVGSMSDMMALAAEEPLTFVTSFHFNVDDEMPEEVFLVGSFTNWTEGKIPMRREPDKNIFSATANLPLGIHSYKFIVNGEWRFAHDQPRITDERGNINNCIAVTRPLLRRRCSHDDTVDAYIPWSEVMPGSPPASLFYNQLLLPGVREKRQQRPVKAETGFKPSESTRSLTKVAAEINAMALTTREVAKERHEASQIPKDPPSPTTDIKSFLIAADEAAEKRPRRPSLNPGGNTYPAFDTPKHRLMLVMVGLPARGKSFISRKLCRYLNWMGYPSKVFNLGQYRRNHLGAFHTHDFFNPDNAEGQKAREGVALAVLDDVMDWYKTNAGSVAIFDGTNTTRRRRALILDRVQQEEPNLIVKTIFVEVICNDPEVIETNILATKLKSPDYVDAKPEDIIADFRQRIAHYELAYEPLGKRNDSSLLRYIKIFEVGKQLVANRITGFVPSRIMFYLSNLHIIPRPIYLARHGQSQYNLAGRIGGDSGLTELGQKFAGELRTFMANDTANSKLQLCVWSSTLQRTIQTAENVSCGQYISWKNLDEIHAGECEGLTYAEVEERFPEEFRARQEDKLRYRYVRGESYEDVIRRLEPVIIELERQQNPILIVAHQAVLRCLYAYIMDKTRDEVPFLPVPLHTVIKLTPKPYGTEEERFPLV